MHKWGGWTPQGPSSHLAPAPPPQLSPRPAPPTQRSPRPLRSPSPCRTALQRLALGPRILETSAPPARRWDWGPSRLHLAFHKSSCHHPPRVCTRRLQTAHTAPRSAEIHRQGWAATAPRPPVASVSGGSGTGCGGPLTSQKHVAPVPLATTVSGAQERGRLWCTRSCSRVSREAAAGRPQHPCPLATRSLWLLPAPSFRL